VDERPGDARLIAKTAGDALQVRAIAADDPGGIVSCIPEQNLSIAGQKGRINRLHPVGQIQIMPIDRNEGREKAVVTPNVLA
jgi:hypothetical protein